MTHPISRRARTAFAIAVTGIVLSGCGSKSTIGTVASASETPASAEGSWVGRNQVKQAIVLLNRGEAVQARKLLMSVLKKQPGDSVARQLIGQIDGDPKVLLGSQNYSYTLKEGETLSVIAQRVLGNPMMFYALARYNNIAVPTSVRPGQTILIPGRAPAPPAARKPAGKPAPATSKAPATVAKPAPVKPTERATNPALASKLRGQGLAAMNAGAINRAVSLLRRALSLDPDNGAIKRDLGRALRIQGTVRANP